MTRRQQLSDAQMVTLFDPPTEQRELVRHYTLSDVDLIALRRCRGDHNRLGRALMLCYLRYPGRPLRAGERPPESLVAFVAEQIDVLPQSIDSYRSTGRHVHGIARGWKQAVSLRRAGLTQKDVAATSVFLDRVSKGKITLGKNSMVIVEELSQVGRGDMLQVGKRR